MSIDPWIKAAQSLFFPNSCLFCGNPLWIQPPDICHLCRNSMQKIYPDYFDIYRMKIDAPAMDRVLIAYRYDTILQELFERMKYNGEKEIASLLGKLAYEVLAQYIPPSATFIPVPLHPKKRRQRGYNQAELIADSLAASAKGRALNCVRRTFYTQTQTKLSKSERQKNVRGVFSIDRAHTNTLKQINEIYIVDDVITTGATLNELARTIKKSYPHIYITVIAVATPLVKDVY